MDWVFVYRYRAPTNEDSTREKDITIAYDMRPRDIKDDEYPNMAITDMDTIFVIEPRSSLIAIVQQNRNEGSDFNSPAGLQVFGKEFKKTEIYNHTEELSSIISRQRMTIAQQEKAIAELKTSNAQLMQLNTQLQQDCFLAPDKVLPDMDYHLGSPRPSRQDGPILGPHALPFMDRLESVREPMHPSQQVSPLQFPTFSEGECDALPAADPFSDFQPFSQVGYDRAWDMWPHLPPLQDPIYDVVSNAVGTQGSGEEIDEEG